MEYLRIGIITKPHGVKGGVRIQPLTEHVDRFRGMTEAYLERHGTYSPVSLSDIAVRPDGVTLLLSGCTTREDAELLRDAFICVSKDNAIKLPEGRWFICDLVGCSVVLTDGTAVGRMTDVIQNAGSADVYELDGGRVMFPALKKLIVSVDVAAKRIVLDAEVYSEVALVED